MREILLWGFFVLLLNILINSACASTSTAEAGESESSKRQKHPKLMSGTIMESSVPGNQGTFPGLHVVQHTTTQKAKTIVGGGANDPRRPRNGHNSAKSNLIKTSSLFMTAIKHLAFGLLLVVCCF